MVMVDLASIPALGTTPVPGDLPAGESLRYDPDYEALSAEMGKLGTPDASTIDWKLVTNRSVSLLERTKDLFLASAMTHGLLLMHGMAGYAAGLKAMHGMVTTFWDGLLPAKNRMRARTSAFSWLSERADAYFADPANAKALDAVHVLAAAATAEELFAYCTPDKLEGEDSGLGGLLRNLREAKEKVGGSAPAASESGDAGAGSDAGGSASSSGSSAGGKSMTINIPAAGAALNPAGVIATRDEAFRRLAELADFFIRAEPLSPVGHLLLRASNWGKMSYKDLYMELLAQNRDGRAMLMDALGIKREEGSES
jgi:type VI secretion system ImpA/VasJ family protein